MVNSYDFDVTFTCRHEECSEQFKTEAVEQIKKLSKYHPHIIDGDITIDKQNSSIVKIEAIIRVPGQTLIGKFEDHDHEKALDAAVQKLKAQLKKLKSKIATHRGPTHEEVVDIQENRE